MPIRVGAAPPPGNMAESAALDRKTGAAAGAKTARGCPLGPALSYNPRPFQFRRVGTRADTRQATPVGDAEGGEFPLVLYAEILIDGMIDVVRTTRARIYLYVSARRHPSCGTLRPSDPHCIGIIL